MAMRIRTFYLWRRAAIYDLALHTFATFTIRIAPGIALFDAA